MTDRKLKIALRCGPLLATVALASLSFAQQASDDSEPPRNPATVQELPQVFVIGNAPLPGFGLPLREVPANVQSADSTELRDQQTLDIADFLNNNFSGVNVSESQGNPLQADVYYHGFTASPLIGTPQGLSVYVDSVRVNESFGDTVNWDLIPEAAISTITLMPGSNPVFGLNTLGGALSVQTKNGHDNPGTELQGYAGSFGRTDLTAFTGGSRAGFDWFLAGNDLDEHGWRDQSPTHARQLFGKTGWQNEHTDLDLSYSWADNSMTGNGATPQSLLDHRYSAIYSAPDYTHNHLNFVNLVGSQFVTDQWLLSGNVYYRELQTGSNNGDVNNENYLSGDYAGPPIDCVAPLTTHAASAYCSNGINRSSTLTQKTAGFGLQLTGTADRFGGRNQLVLGTELSHATDSYEQRSAYATLTAERTAISNDNPADPNQVVNSLAGTNAIWGVYFTDTWSPIDVLHLSVSARYNDSHESLDGYSVDTDLGDFGHGFDSVRPLTGNHSFSRLNPALGFTLTPNRVVNVFANYSESSRAPTVIELGCSDPSTPCGLPNDFASDPDLQQVVSKSYELGARGAIARQTVNWSADLFHTANYHDIQFIATTASTGFFSNVGTTRRQGLDVSLGGKLHELAWHLAYSLIDATYQSGFLVNAESNSSADANGNIAVTAGARIPLVPRHTGRLLIDYGAKHGWDVGGAVVMCSGAYLHGNENNANVAGATNAAGDAVIGSGRIGSYAVVNLFGTVRVARTLEIFARVNNVLNRKYATAGFLTSNAFAADGSFHADPSNWTNENAISPAAPLAAWIGIRAHWE